MYANLLVGLSKWIRYYMYQITSLTMKITHDKQLGKLIKFIYTRYSAAQICPYQNICVIRVSPIRIYAHTRVYRYARMPH